MLSVLTNTEGMIDSVFMKCDNCIDAWNVDHVHGWWRRRPLKRLPRGWREHSIPRNPARVGLVSIWEDR